MLVHVAVPFRIPGPLVYQLPDSLKAAPGSRLSVPLGKRRVIGCLIGPAGPPAPKGLREVESVLDETPLFTALQMRLLSWASRYYLTPVGEVLRHLAPPEFFRKRNPFPRRTEATTPFCEFAPESLPQLNPEQREVLEKILASPKAPFLLQGITGSGKTEIYIQLARRFAKGQVLVLVPEIALTPQLIGRFGAALSSPVFPYHSGLTGAQRLAVWQKVRSGQPLVVIGTRSAVFLPSHRLELIVVDEEHDSSYKQEERFCYNARDLALWRAKEEGAIVVLGSATPSLESLYRCHQGKMQLLRITARPEGVSLPRVQIIDRRREENGNHCLSDPLKRALSENLQQGEQSLLFINRRGFAPFVTCRSCGFVPRCAGCDISLTYHKKERCLSCHYCDRRLPLPDACPKCRRQTLHPQGTGTERIEEELKKLFPTARIARLDRDVGKGRRMIETLSRMKSREIDILVGTQTVTKGHDYPHLTLVGIVEADTALHLPDFRAAEKTFQLTTQVSGRSGRGERPGRVLIQTYQPEHPALAAAVLQDSAPFVEWELKTRREAHYPPFCRLVRIILSGRNQQKVEKTARMIAARFLILFKQNQPRRGVEGGTQSGFAGWGGDASPSMIGPSPCPLPRIRGRHRWHLLVKSRQFAKVHPHLEALLDEFSRNDLPSGVRMLANVDPMEMM